MRAPNEIDFWRGFALLTIFIDHIPGIVFERFTFPNVSVSDSAELFVFLAGWSLRYVVTSGTGTASPLRLTLRLAGRALQIYVAQITITVLAIALIAAAALALDAPLLLQWHNAGAVFEDPASAQIGIVMLTHQLGYFNILPLYVTLMATAPLIALCDRFSPTLLLVLSAGLYVATLIFAWNLPTWPVEGSWFLDPLSWQFIFVTGFLLSGPGWPGRVARRLRWTWLLAGLPLLVAGAVATVLQYSPDPMRVPDPKLLFIFDKTFLSPARLIAALALAAVFHGAFEIILGRLPPVGRYFSMLGRNSLNVFCVGSLLSLAGQLVRFSFGGDVRVDCFVLALGVTALGATAWLSEWREHLARGLPSPR